MRKLSLALVVASIACGCDGGSDGPPDLSVYNPAYANPVCNTVDQQLAPARQDPVTHPRGAVEVRLLSHLRN